jgi:hypothetical protein
VKSVLAVILILSFASVASSQDLSGFWSGTLTMGGGCFAVNNIELQIKGTGTKIYGDSYHFENVNHYVKKKMTGEFDPASKKLLIHETIITTFHIPNTCKICIKNFYLTYQKNGNIETLSGYWDGKMQGTNADCSTGPILLSRVRESAFKEVPEIIVDTGRIRLDFYDNAEVDGDSITVLVNKTVVLAHQRLSTRPITTYVMIDLGNKFQEIEMVAENLGSIPPNTAILIVTAGSKKYQLFLTSTQNKSAMVRFVYDEKDDPPK